MTGGTMDAEARKRRAKERYAEQKLLTPEERASRKAAHAERRAAAAERRRLDEKRKAPFLHMRQAAITRLRIARDRLSAQNLASPVAGYAGKAARLAAAQRRAQQRVDHLVLGKERPVQIIETVVRKRKGGRKTVRTKVPVRLEPGVEEAYALRENAPSDRHGTPETLAKAAGHTDCLLQLERNGTIDREQLEWAAEIANVHRAIEADVAIGSASFEARVDGSRHGDRNAEGVRRVRMHMAYGYWRDELPMPKRLVLDMIVGDAIGYTVAARRHRVGNLKAKRALLAALNRWPDCVAWAYRMVSDEDIREAQDELTK